MEILLTELERIQEKYGYLPEEEILRVAQKREIPKAELYGIISFYSRFYFEKPGKYIIRICKSVTCGMNKNEEIINTVRKYLDKIGNDKAKERLFEFELVECLSHCDSAPVMTINDKVYRNMTPSVVLDTLYDYSKGGDKHA